MAKKKTWGVNVRVKSDKKFWSGEADHKKDAENKAKSDVASENGVKSSEVTVVNSKELKANREVG